jgi:aryl-alcohol dehydrogenase (NADP+)
MYYTEDDFVIADTVADIAKKRGVSPARIACAWVLQAPGVTAPIIGATKVSQIQDLIGAVDLKLTAEEIAALEKPYRPHPILGHAQPSARNMLAR